MLNCVLRCCLYAKNQTLPTTYNRLHFPPWHKWVASQRSIKSTRRRQSARKNPSHFWNYMFPEYRDKVISIFRLATSISKADLFSQFSITSATSPPWYPEDDQYAALTGTLAGHVAQPIAKSCDTRPLAQHIPRRTTTSDSEQANREDQLSLTRTTGPKRYHVETEKKYKINRSQESQKTKARERSKHLEPRR